MLIEFLANKRRLNIIRLIASGILLYAVSTKFSFWETLLLTLLVIVINLVTLAKATADGMKYAKISRQLMNKLIEERRKKKN